MSNIIHGESGVNVKNPGGGSFTQGLGLPIGQDPSAPLFVGQGTQIRYNEDKAFIEYWSTDDGAWRELAKLDDINTLFLRVDTYAMMMSVVNESISNTGRKPYAFLVSNDENRDQENTLYNFFPDSTTPSNSVLRYIPSEGDMLFSDRLADACLLGTSLTRQHNSFAGGVHTTGGNGIWNWANWLLGSPFDFSQNLGVTGDFAINIFSRIHQIRADLDNVIIDCLTNDIINFSSSSTAPQIASEISRLIGVGGVLPTGLMAIKNMGKTVTIITCPPNNAISSSSDARIEVLDAVNAWVMDAVDDGYADYVVDLFTACWDSAQPTIRVFKTGYTTDGTHLSNRAGYAGGVLGKAVLSEIYKTTKSRSNKYYNYNNSISILSQMRTISGISSTISFGTGSLASGWRSLNSGSGAAPTLVLSQTSYTKSPDYIGPNSFAVGIDEKWQKLAITNTASGNIVRLQLATDIANNTDPGISAGDHFFITCEVMVENPVNLNLVNVRAFFSFVNGTTPVDQSYSSSAAQSRTSAGQSSVSGTEFAYESGFRALFCTIPVRAPENISAATPVTAQIFLDANFNGVGSANVYFARPCFWRKQA